MSKSSPRALPEEATVCAWPHLAEAGSGISPTSPASTYFTRRCRCTCRKLPPTSTTASRLEAFGIVLLEAMACKVPVLAFDTPGVNEVALQGGRVFTSTNDLAKNILEMHENEPLRLSLGRRGRQAVQEKYSWKSALDEIESVYEEVA